MGYVGIIPLSAGIEFSHGVPHYHNGKMQHVGGLESRSIDHGGLGAIAVCVLEGCTPFRGILGEIRTFQKMDPHTTDFPQRGSVLEGKSPYFREI